MTAAVKELHTYAVPEVLALDVTSGSDAYLDWVRANTHSSNSMVTIDEVSDSRAESQCDAGAVTSHATTGDVLSTQSALKVAAESIKYTADGTSEAGSV